MATLSQSFKSISFQALILIFIPSFFCNTNIVPLVTTRTTTTTATATTAAATTTKTTTTTTKSTTSTTKSTRGKAAYYIAYLSIVIKVANRELIVFRKFMQTSRVQIQANNNKSKCSMSKPANFPAHDD